MGVAEYLYTHMHACIHVVYTGIVGVTDMSKAAGQGTSILLDLDS